MDMTKTSVKVDTKPAKTKKRKGKSLEKKKARMGWFFVLPFVLGFFFVYFPMIVQSLQFSFSDMERAAGGGGFQLTWNSFKNYNYALFEDTEYLKILISSLKQLVFDIPAIVIFSLFLAIMLNQKMRGRAVFRAIFFLPVIVSTGIIESIDLQNTLASAMGEATTTTGAGGSGASGANIIQAIDVQKFFASMKIGTQLVSYVTGLVNDVYNIINRSGVQMLVFLSGLQSISPAIYESCYMEGASAWETFWKITFPMISPMILVNAIYTIIDSFTTESNGVMKYIINFNDGRYTAGVQAAAMSWIYFVIVIVIIAAVAGVISAYVFYQRRD